MTPKQVLKSRRKDIIDRATSLDFVYQEYFDGPEWEDTRLDERILIHCVESYFIDLERKRVSWY